MGFDYFPNAKWMTGVGNKELIIETARKVRVRAYRNASIYSTALDTSRIMEVTGEFLPGIYALPLPGHTPCLYGIAFADGDKRIVHASDAVVTRRHFEDRVTENQNDREWARVAAKTISDIAESFDIVIPGHDNIIVI
jgi:glyoxylase-like metal-dependent hydrolase (beta-lactamase superfamily II)